jgi:hypothetical protein
MSYILTDEKQIERALKKARKMKPLVKMVCFGSYQVRGANGNLYEVRCERTANGEKLVDCTCKGGERGLVCYHSVAAVGLHIAVAEQLQTAKAEVSA